MKTKHQNATIVVGNKLPKMFDREPPQSIEAEMCLLGCMILDHDLIDDVLPIVSRAEAFANDAHGAIFQHLVRLHNDKQTGDMVQLLQSLKDSGVLDLVGGEAYVLRLAESVPFAANAVHYAKIVWQKARRRGLIRAAGKVLYRAYDDNGDEDSMLAEAEHDILSVGDDGMHPGAVPLSDAINRAVDAGTVRQSGGSVGIKTGLKSIDAIIVGFQPGDYIVIGARPSMGKTSGALTIARNIAAGGVPVCIFSLEMGEVSLADRLLCAEAGVDSKRWRLGEIDRDEARRIASAQMALSALPIYIDPRSDLTIQDARAAARRVVRRNGVGVIMIDYLQLLGDSDTGADNLYTRVTSVSKNIKAMARENNVPVVCLSQLNRSPTARNDNRPKQSDLRDSGSIEQDADIILLLHREAYYHRDDDEWLAQHVMDRDVAEWIVAKNRNGEIGTASTVWNGRYQTFISC